MHLQAYKRKPFIFNRLPIQQRLPLFILLLLLIVVGAFSSVSYLEVKKNALANGTERVTTLADKLSSIFQKSIDHFAESVKTVALDKSIISYLNSKNPKDSLRALNFLNNSGKKDTANKLIQLLNVQKQLVLSWSSGNIAFNPDIDMSNSAPSGKGTYTGVGKILQANGLIYFPVLAYVRKNNEVVGYVVNWRILRATQADVDQLGQILGGNGRVYFGNDDNSLWTNLLKPIARPPVDLKRLQHTALYSRSNNVLLIGAVRPLANSRWLVLVELSGANMMKTAHTFLLWVIIIGSVLVLLGGFGGWLMSRTIIKPLEQLSTAASSIAEGKYSQAIVYHTEDAVGRLTESFNIMAAKIHLSRQHLEQKVEDRTKELQAAHSDITLQEEIIKRKDEFISIASHELKTPLTTIKAFFQIAEKEIPPDFKSYNLIPRAARQVNRMEHLISNLLDVSKINSNNMAFKPVVFDVGQVLHDAVHNIQHISPNHQLIILQSLSATINGDANRIEQAISNLLDNAVKFSPEGGNIVISCQQRRNKLDISIKDFGIGMTAQTIEMLFKRFSRATEDYRFQGLGLGLFISAEIIKRHGGTILVQSTLGKGSEFTIQLPIALNGKYNNSIAE